MNRAFSRRVRYSCLVGVSGAAILAAGISSPTLHDLTVSLGDGMRLEIGTVRGGGNLVGIAFAQSADSVTLETSRSTSATSAIRRPGSSSRASASAEPSLPHSSISQ